MSESSYWSAASRLTAGNGYPSDVQGSPDSLSQTKGAHDCIAGVAQEGAERGESRLSQTKEDRPGVAECAHGQQSGVSGSATAAPRSATRGIQDSGKRRYTLRPELKSDTPTVTTRHGLTTAKHAPLRQFTYQPQPKREAMAARAEIWRDSNEQNVGEAAGGREAAHLPLPLPCLFRNNCIQTIGEPQRKLTGAERKRAHTCMENTQHFINTYGLENCGFLTITHPEAGSIGFVEFQRRLHSAMTNFLRPAFEDYMGAMEYSPGNREHLHFIVACGTDIRTGFDFDHYHATRVWQKAQRRTPKPVGNLNRCQWLKEMHASLNDRLPDYGLGRPELVPIWKSAEAVGYYLGGYLAKSIPNRLPEHKGARFMRYSKTAPRIVKGSFAWIGIHSWLWRRKLAAFAASHDCKNEEELKSLFGSHWAYHMRAAILAVDLTWYLTGHHANADGKGEDGMDLDVEYHCPPRPETGFEARRILQRREISHIIAGMPGELAQTQNLQHCQQSLEDWNAYNRPF